MKNALLFFFTVLSFSHVYGQNESRNQKASDTPGDNFIGIWHSINGIDTITIRKDGKKFIVENRRKKVVLKFIDGVLKDNDPPSEIINYLSSNHHLYWHSKEMEYIGRPGSADNSNNDFPGAIFIGQWHAINNADMITIQKDGERFIVENHGNKTILKFRDGMLQNDSFPAERILYHASSKCVVWHGEDLKSIGNGVSAIVNKVEVPGNTSARQSLDKSNETINVTTEQPIAQIQTPVNNTRSNNVPVVQSTKVTGQSSDSNAHSNSTPVIQPVAATIQSPDNNNRSSITGNAKKKSDSKIVFGLEAGLNIAILNVQYTGNEYTYNYKIAGRFGVIADLPLANKFYIEPGIFYAMNGTKGSYNDGNNSASTTIYINTIEIPVNFIYKFGQPEGNHFFLGAGPYFGYNISAHITGTVTDLSTNISQTATTTAQIGSVNGTDYLKALDLGLGLNAGYQLANRLFFRFRFQTGLSNMSPNSGVTIHTSSIGIQVGCLFGKKAKNKKNNAQTIIASPSTAENRKIENIPSLLFNKKWTIKMEQEDGLGGTYSVESREEYFQNGTVENTTSIGKLNVNKQSNGRFETANNGKYIIKYFEGKEPQTLEIISLQEKVLILKGSADGKTLVYKAE